MTDRVPDLGLSAILSNVDDGVTVQDASGRLVFANDAAARLSGFASAEEMLAADIPRLIDAFDMTDEHGNRLAADALPGRQVLAGRDVEPMIVRSRIRGSDVQRYSRIAARPIRGADGQIDYVVNTFHDVTDLKRNEASLAFLVEAASILASSLDYAETLRRVSQLAVPSMADWCVVDIGEPGGPRERVAVWHPDPEKRVMAEEIQRRFPAPAPSGEALELLRRGEPTIVDLTDQVLQHAADSRGPEYLEALRDLNARQALLVPLVIGDRVIGSITYLSAESGRRFGPEDLAYARLLARPAALAVENARLYHSLQEAVHVRETFLQMAAHELLTPITVVRGYSQTLARQVDRSAASTAPDGTVAIDANRLRESAQRLDAGTQRLTRLIHDLLDLSRIQRGTLEMSPLATDIGSLMREVVESARLRQQEGRYAGEPAIELSLPEEPIVGHWDPLRLEQVFYNVIDNALKYSPGSGPVRLGVTGTSDRARVTIRDEGIGIPTDMLEVIFQPFTRAPNVSTQGFPGFGMGLAISHEIVQRHGGRIAAESAGPDTGTQIVIELPYEFDAGSGPIGES